MSLKNNSRAHRERRALQSALAAEKALRRDMDWHLLCAQGKLAKAEQKSARWKLNALVLGAWAVAATFAILAGV